MILKNKMFGIRTPTKVTAPQTHTIEEKEGPASTQPPTPALTPAVRKSIGDLEAAIARSAEAPKKQKLYKNMLTEAAALQQSALLQLDAARNLKGEIKAAVTSAVKRLYELIKEADAQLKEGRDKKKENEGKCEETVEKEGEANKTYKIDTTSQIKKGDMYKLEEQINRLKRENDRMEETSKLLRKEVKAFKATSEGQGNMMVVEEVRKELREYRREEEERRMTYAEAATPKGRNNIISEGETIKTSYRQGPMHSIIIKSTGPESSGELLERIRNTVDAKNTGLNVDKIRKIKDQRIVIGCTTTERLGKITDRLNTDPSFVVETATTKDPLVVLRDVIKCHTDEEVVAAIKIQNQNLLKDLKEEIKIAVKYRRRARNPHTENIVLQVSPQVWKKLTEAGRVHIDLQRVWVQDQSPLIQCSRCLGFGHGRKHCKEADPTCSHCGGLHLKTDCPEHTAGVPAKCVNCRKAKNSSDAHNAFDLECPMRRRWDMLARSSVAYC